jgi:CRP/FNR family transcriptional regulator, cyclic AMP receptor protein
MRLREMLQLTRRVEQATAGNNNMDWIKPFTSTRWMSADEILFRKGDTADRLFIVVSGRCRLLDSGIEIGPGDVVGELALVSPDKARTQTLQCEEGGELLEISYGHVKQLYFQNPVFGFYLLELTSQRLFNDVRRLEKEIAQLRARLVETKDKSSAETNLPRTDIS